MTRLQPDLPTEDDVAKRNMAFYVENADPDAITSPFTPCVVWLLVLFAGAVGFMLGAWS